MSEVVKIVSHEHPAFGYKVIEASDFDPAKGHVLYLPDAPAEVIVEAPRRGRPPKGGQ